jgi:transposase-like protein
MSMYYIDGCSFRQIAGLLDVNERNVSRWIRKITTRLLAGQYIRCLRNRRFFSSADLQIAKDYYIGGQTLRQIAAEGNCSYYEVRRAIERIGAILEAVETVEGRRQQTEFSPDENGRRL